MVWTTSTSSIQKPTDLLTACLRSILKARVLCCVEFCIEGADPAAWHPMLYNPTDRMHYQRTFVFPLQKAGNFNSKVTGVKVVQDM